ncbi:helix-turn-helix transcriptional regulator [Bradyrhizobium huanghuaihaiense]
MGAAPEIRHMLTEQEVLAKVPVSYSTLRRMEKRGEFPQSTYISPNRRLWFADEIAQWQAEMNGRRRGRRHHPAPKKAEA